MDLSCSLRYQRHRRRCLLPQPSRKENVPHSWEYVNPSKSARPGYVDQARGDMSPPCQPIAPEPGRWSRAAKRPGLTLDRRPRSGAPRRRSGGIPTPIDRRGAGGRRKRGAAPPRPPGGSRAGRAKPDRAAARRREGGPDGGRAGARTRGARSGAEGKAQPSPEQPKGDPGQAPSPPGAEPGRAAARPAARTAGGRSRPRGGRGPAR